MNLTLVLKVYILLAKTSHMATTNYKEADNSTIYQEREKQQYLVNMTNDLPQLRKNEENRC